MLEARPLPKRVLLQGLIANAVHGSAQATVKAFNTGEFGNPDALSGVGFPARLVLLALLPQHPLIQLGSRVCHDALFNCVGLC